jgi:hypothetical protein
MMMKFEAKEKGMGGRLDPYKSERDGYTMEIVK